MELRKNDWVWMHIHGGQHLAQVLEVRAHAVDVRPYDGQLRVLLRFHETVSLHNVTKADLSPEELSGLPCGKRILTMGKAFEIVAANRIFRDNPARQERRVYYCTRCRGYHLTRQVKIAYLIRQGLRERPYRPIGTEDYAKGSHRTRVLRWLRDDIGVPLTNRLFELSLRKYGPSHEHAIRRLLDDPLAYLGFVYLRVFLPERRKQRLGLNAS